MHEKNERAQRPRSWGRLSRRANKRKNTWAFFWNKRRPIPCLRLFLRRLFAQHISPKKSESSRRCIDGNRGLSARCQWSRASLTPLPPFSLSSLFLSLSLVHLRGARGIAKESARTGDVAIICRSSSNLHQDAHVFAPWLEK